MIMTVKTTYLAKILGSPVISDSGRQAGYIVDFSIVLLENKPRISQAIIFDFNTSTNKLASKDCFSVFNPNRFELSTKTNDLPPYHHTGNMVTATQLWDKSVIDTTNVRTIAVNDICLAFDDQEEKSLWVSGVDISFRAAMRRMKLDGLLTPILRKLGFSMQDEVIPWEKIIGFNEQFTSLTTQITSDHLQTLHPADLADILDDLPAKEQMSVIENLDDELAAETLAEAEEYTQVQIIERLDTETASEIIEEMDPDEAADLLQDMDQDKAKAILDHMDSSEASDVRKLLKYGEDTAGGLMTTEYAAIYEDFTVSDAFSHLRLVVADIEIIYYMYIIDSQERLKGVVSIRDLLSANPNIPISEIMDDDLVSVTPDTPQEDVANLISKYDFMGIPVVNEQNEIMGVVTVDDVMDVMEEEASEDIFKLAGSSEDELTYTSPLQACKARLPWLLITLGTGFLTSTILKHFMTDFKQVIALSYFVPVVMAMGGNTGIQSSTLVIRGLALDSFSGSELLGKLLKEIYSGALMGLSCGLIVGVWAEFLIRSGASEAGAFSSTYFALTVGSAMMAAMTFAAMFGALVPIIFEKLEIDPAVASGPFVTSSNDIFALLIYYGVAMLMLSLATG